MNVRAARGEDFERVLPLVLELGRPPDHHRTHEDIKVLYEQQVVDPNAHHLVAEDEDGHIIGFLALHFRMRIGWVTSEAWVADLIVADGARQAGVGRALIDEAESVARARESHRLVLDSGYRDAEAHQLFRSSGMRDMGKHFVKHLT